MYFPGDDDTDEGLGGMRPQSRTPKSFSLKLTSLIDMFTLILVFLLKSFSAEGEIMTVTDDLKLPESTSQKKPEVASIIAINHENILLDGEIVVETAVVNGLSNQTMIIRDLADALKMRKALAEGLGQVNEQMDHSGKINIQADQNIPYSVIKKVMVTCAQGGYNDMMLAVIEKE